MDTGSKGYLRSLPWVFRTYWHPDWDMGAEYLTGDQLVIY